MAYETELQVAIEAVREAATLCQAVQGRLEPDLELSKQDKSPVTVADFGAQALICRRLQEAFPDDRVIGEESADALRDEANAGLLEQVVTEVRAVLGDASPDAVCGWIDRANLDDGVLFSAVAGEGAWVHPLAGGERQRVSVSETAQTADMRWCESVEAAHQAHSVSARIADALGTAVAPRRIDSMLKYGLVARGDAELYLRLPKKAGYREKIWDHAAGALVVTEAGGRASDLDGAPLDFSAGSRLGNEAGIVVSNGTCHDAILETVRRVRAEG
jgi:3'(2'), 5'-bisphosphate nucleotidase